jgi:signal transduction histidine kinase
VAESVAHFAAEVDRWRHLFLGVLGHDLRSPLNAILLTAQLLSKLASDAPVTRYTQSLIRSGERMKALLDDLLDYSRVSLGLGLAIHRVPVDLAAACEEEVELLRAALPGHSVGYEVEGCAQGDFDGSRVREALGNLVLNAARYGSQDRRIEVRLVGDGQTVQLSVANEGKPMTAEALQALFEPLRRGAVESSEPAAGQTNLGLGLFVVREVARAHGGQVDVVCEAGRTVFRLTLPSGTDGSRAAGRGSVRR